MSTDDHLYLIEQLADEFFAKKESGDGTSVNEFVATYPEHASELRDFIQGLELVRGFHQEQERPSRPVPLVGTKSDEFPSIDDYRVIRELGRGAMGVVYEAEQVSLGRRVALKTMLHTGEETGKLRFQHEARTAARLHHPGIVPVYDVGEVDGLMYYAMQYINGRGLDRVSHSVDNLLRSNTSESESVTGELADWLVCGHDASDTDNRTRRSSASGIHGRSGSSTDTSKRGPKDDSKPKSSSSHGRRSRSQSGRYRQYHRSIARIGWHVADALAFAHDQNVIHRDIKPANLLLDVNGEVWVADFGLVKTEDAGLTQTGAFVGTLRYMAPERFQGECDARSDVYSLGMTLYELLALRPALDSPDQMSLLNQIRDTEPPSLRNIEHRVPRDLEVIVMRAIQKEPHRRYATAQLLADDLDNFLHGRPIQARHVSTVEKTFIWARRKPIVASLLCALIVGLFATIVGSVCAAFAFRDVAAVATAAKLEAESTLARSNYFLAWARWEDDRTKEANDYLELVPPDYRNIEWALASREFRGGYLAFNPGKRGVNAVQFSPSGDFIFAAGADRGITISDAGTGELLRKIKTDLKDVTSLVVSADGFTVAAAGRAGRLGLWDIESGELIWEYLKSDCALKCIQFSPNSRGLALAYEDGVVTLLESESGEVVWSVKGHSNDTNGVSYHPDGTQLVTVGTDRVIRFWDVRNGEPLAAIDAYTGNSVAYSPDGKSIAVGGRSGNITRYAVSKRDTAGDRKNGDGSVPGAKVNSIALTVASVMRGHTKPVSQLKFCPDGARLVSASGDSTVRIWEAKTGAELKKLRGHLTSVDSVDVAPDGYRIVSAGAKIRLWDGRGSGAPVTYWGHNSQVDNIEFSEDGRQMLSNCSDQIRLWDTYTLEDIREFTWNEKKTSQARFTPDAKHVIACSDDGKIQVWDRTTGGAVGSYVRGNGNIEEMDFNESGTLLAIADEREATILDLARLTELTELRVPLEKLGAPHPAFVRTLDGFDKDVICVAFGPIDGVLATGDRNGDVVLWNADTGGPIRRLYANSERVNTIRFSTDGKQIFTVGNNRGQARQAESGQVLYELTGHREQVRGIAVTKDGNRIATGSSDETIRIWDAKTGAQLCKLEVGVGINAVEFSPDGNRLAAAHKNGVSIWHASLDPDHDVDAAAAKLKMVQTAYPAWHAKQAELARLQSDWFAALVHRVRQLQSDPDSIKVKLLVYIAAKRLQAEAPSSVRFLPSIASENGFVQTVVKGQDPEFTEQWADATQKYFLPMLAEDSSSLSDTEFELMQNMQNRFPSPLNVRTFALMAYRYRQFETAIATIESMSDRISFDLNILAMSHLQLGHRKLARSMRSESRALSKKEQSFDELSVEAKLLRREVNDMFKEGNSGEW